LEQFVRSALTQSINTEVVVVQSKLTSPSNLRTLARLQQQYTNLSVLLEDKSPHHFPAAINMGIRHATADRVGLVFSDDWIDQTTVAECLVITRPRDDGQMMISVASGRKQRLEGGRFEAECEL
jgi:hypothetical protein